MILLAGVAGLTVSVRALEGARGTEETRSQTTYYANGQVETECAIRDGHREGECRRFSADGRKLAEGSYAAGRMEGPWTFWLPDGSIDLERSGRYEAGVRAGS
jgi:antitoxin component YwqK of YwqJK toxin-antitoxin module